MAPAPSNVSLNLRTSWLNFAPAGIPVMPLKSNTNSSHAPDLVTGTFNTATPFAGVPPTAASNSTFNLKEQF